MNLFDTFIVQPIFNLLIGLYSLIPGGDFGIALILFTIIVRLALWPLVKKQLHQVKAMQKLQPELARIKKEVKGDRRLESMRMMELYKKHDVSPFRSIGVLLIQLPIFIALFQVIQIFTLHRDQVAKFTYDFLEGVGPIKQLIAHPESFNEKLLGFIDLTQQAIMSNPFKINFILLALALVAVYTQYVMSKQTMPNKPSKKRLRDVLNEASEGKQTNQTEMNAIVMGKMTKFLPIMMFFIMISLPGALALYYTVSNLMAVFQQGSVLKQDAEEMIEIADQTKPLSSGKKATAKARLKIAQNANITRIVAKEGSPIKANKKEKI